MYLRGCTLQLATMPKTSGKKKRGGASYKRKQHGRTGAPGAAAGAGAAAAGSGETPKLHPLRREALRRYLREPTSSLVWDVVSQVHVPTLMNRPLSGKKRCKYRPPQHTVGAAGGAASLE